MKRDALHEIAEVSAETLTHMIPSSDVDRLGGYVPVLELRVPKRYHRAFSFTE